MRLGLPLAIILHALMFWAGYWVFPHSADDFQDASIIVPLELVVPDDTTNLAFSSVETPKPVPTPEVKEAEVPAPEVIEPDEPEDVTDAPVDEPNAPEDAPVDETSEPEAAPDEVEPEAADEPETPEPTPTPAKSPDPEPTPDAKDEPPKPNRSLLERALKTADKRKQERTTDRQAREAANLKAVEDANRVERSVGDRMRDTATWTDMLKSKIETSCYRDTSDMANADRLRATYSITFNRDGTLKRPPRRTQPAQIPMGDQQLRVFDINAQRAIQKCAPYSDIFPPELYDEWKDFTFIFGK